MFKKGEYEKILYRGFIHKITECESRPTGVK